MLAPGGVSGSWVNAYESKGFPPNQGRFLGNVYVSRSAGNCCESLG
jgi:hypothetical protein